MYWPCKSQSQVLDHGTEVPVVLKQTVVVFDAESSDDKIRKLCDGYPVRPKDSIISGRSKSDLLVEHLDNLVPSKLGFQSICVGLVLGPPQHFQK